MSTNHQVQRGSILMSKGSKRRPRSVPADKFSDNWDRIFNKPKGDNTHVKKSKDNARPSSGNHEVKGL